MDRTLPAAAVPKWSEVVDPTTGKTITVELIFNATPRPGRITWVEGENTYEVGGNQPIQIISLG